ncbi:AraC family transcriptional regulator [Neptunomonas japonica]|uniref:AraC family transcriptional regulator n=1 Tax=Neptunomonas japonica JAMM 1380 TaxID=1441457 RepID=A0A7R6SWB5_9GAMM|nr:AraC family transcriptional regulator [Neptunomonas japonica]BBB30479.1 AraC family transcriptional regulator [Neptunomonas japonica JAMM 1380]
MEHVTLHNHFLTSISRAVERAGYSNNSLLKQASVSPLILQTPNRRVPLKAFVSYCRGAWSVMDDEFFGLSGQACKPGTFAFLAEQCVSCRNVKEVLKKAGDFYSLFTNLKIQTSIKDKEVCLSVACGAPENDPDHILIDFLLTTWHRFISWLIGTQVVLSKVMLNFAPPEHLHEYKYMLPGPHYFEQKESALCFSTDYLEQPITREPVELAVFLKNFPFSVLVPPTVDNSYTGKVRIIVKQTPEFPNDMFDFEEVALKVNLTPSTLRRKLKSEGSSYQQIKDLLRRDLAIHHMQAAGLSITDIAYRVGFTEPGAFIRAFKGWTGITPGHYRSANG